LAVSRHALVKCTSKRSRAAFAMEAGRRVLGRCPYFLMLAYFIRAANFGHPFVDIQAP
jgi:hypothetical protein